MERLRNKNLGVFERASSSILEFLQEELIKVLVERLSNIAINEVH